MNRQKLIERRREKPQLFLGVSLFVIFTPAYALKASLGWYSLLGAAVIGMGWLMFTAEPRS